MERRKKICKKCGQIIKEKSKQAKYCTSCASSRRRLQDRKRKREERRLAKNELKNIMKALSQGDKKWMTDNISTLKITQKLLLNQNAELKKEIADIKKRIKNKF